MYLLAKKCIDNRDPVGVDATDPAPGLEPGAECDEVQAVLGDRDGRGQQAARGLLHGLRDGAQQRRGQADCGRAGVQQARGLRQHHSRWTAELSGYIWKQFPLVRDHKCVRVGGEDRKWFRGSDDDQNKNSPGGGADWVCEKYDNIW